MSADGRFAALVVSVQDSQSLRIVEIGSTGSLTLHTEAGFLCCPAWSPDASRIAFRTLSDPAPDEISSVSITGDPTHLLMEALRQVDEFSRARERLPDPSRLYQAKTDRLVWEDESTRRVAQEVLAKLGQPRQLEDLVELVHCNRLVLYQVAAGLFETEQIG